MISWGVSYRSILDYRSGIVWGLVSNSLVFWVNPGIWGFAGALVGEKLKQYQSCIEVFSSFVYSRLLRVLICKKYCCQARFPLPHHQPNELPKILQDVLANYNFRRCC